MSMTSREKVSNFMNQLDKAESFSKQRDALKNSSEYKLRRIDATQKALTNNIVEEVIVDLYGKSVKDTSYDGSLHDLRQELDEFMAKQNTGKDAVWYVQEAIKKNGKDCIASQIYETASNISKKFADDKRKQVSEINIDNLEYEADKEVWNNINDISSNMDFDEVSNSIRQNVADTIQKEVERVNNENDFNDKLQSDLENNEDVNTESAIDKAVSKAYAKMPKVYQPSLMEAIMTSKLRENENCDVMTESARELTMHYIMKALKLQNYDIYNVRKMTNDYLKR